MDSSAAFLQLSASLWFKHGTPLLLDLCVSPTPLSHQELSFCSSFMAEVKHMRPALLLSVVHSAWWNTSFLKKHDDIEKMEIQKQHRADC